MSPQQFFYTMRARWLVIFLTLVVAVSVTAVVNLTADKQYTSTAAVVLDVKSPDPVSGMTLAGLMAPGYMATQVDIIKSPRVAKQAVKNLGLDTSATARTQWIAATGGKGQISDWLASLLLRSLSVKPSRESNVINIEYVGSDPDFAAAITNAFAKAYVDINVELRVTPAREYASFFENQTRAARERLDQAQIALSEFQQENGITSTDERLDYETTRLNEISGQLTGVQVVTTDSRSKRLASDPNTVAEAMQSSLINGLKVDIARLRARIEETSVNLGKNHPQILRYESELSELLQQLAIERKQITMSLNTSFEVSREREAQLKAALTAQKIKVLELNQQRDKLKVLRGDIESAQRMFDSVSLRASQSNLESQTNQTNIAVLNPALAPVVPSGPLTKLNIAIATFLGGLLGVIFALSLELSNRRVQSKSDLEELRDLALLGSIGPSRSIMNLLNRVRS